MTTPNDLLPIDILMVEDNPGDVLLIKEALKEGQVLKSLSVARDGAEAIAFLYREGQFAAAISPDLILLDLNLPKMNGYEVLEEIKNHPDLRRIPVIIFTSSQSEQGIAQAYDLHANAYLVKPMDIRQFLATVKAIKEFWGNKVQLPPKQ
ncbi:MAG: response regulator [Acidobacteria bacterium]|nr:response regulator [Acidobacteriota bacterium]